MPKLKTFGKVFFVNLMQKIKISLVSYLNTLPFLYGINHRKPAADYELSLDIPSVCAKKLLNKEAELGIVPLAVCPQLTDYKTVTDFCIGADGAVDSVLLLSDVPLNEIEYIFLDYQSRTSVQLLQILAKQHWKIRFQYRQSHAGYEQQIGGKTAGLVIGDRAFSLERKFKYAYDLAAEWKQMTGLPFVFAVWVASKVVDNQFISSLNSSLAYGVEQIDSLLLSQKINFPSKKISLEHYLKKSISYRLDKPKREAIKLFLSMI